MTYFLNFVQRHIDLKLCQIQSKKIIHQLGYWELCAMKNFFMLTCMTLQNWAHMGPNLVIYRNKYNPLKDDSLKIMHNRVWSKPPKK